MIERVLILSPHTDDGEVSAGGTIARFIEQGKKVYYVAFSSCEKSVPATLPKNILQVECLQATHALGILQSNVILLDFAVRVFPEFRQEILDQMIKIRNEIKPDLVICPSSFDTHQDHAVVHAECIRAFLRTTSIWGMEHPWNNLSFKTDIMVELTDKHIQKKISALGQYNSQSFRDYFKEEYIRGCAYTRGMNAGVRFSESFECIRMLF